MQIDILAKHVEQYAMKYGQMGELTTTGLSNLGIFSKNQKTTFEATCYEPVFCLILQGKKETVIGKQTHAYARGDAIVVSHELPVVSRITEASEGSPYLALVFRLDLELLRNLDDQTNPYKTPSEKASSMIVHSAEGPLIDALNRFFGLLNQPSEIDVLAPLISKEIHFRLLTAPYGAMLRKIANRDSHASRIERAIGLIRERYKSNLRIPELADLVGMSASSFHEHFKAVTQTTPLRYQKDLRLMEAKRLLGEGGLSVSEIAYEIGYESPNQFSREYSRKFGSAPTKDISKSAHVA